MSRFKKFIEDVRKEMKRVSWPSRNEVQGTTIVVVVAVLIVSAYLGLVDLLLGAVQRFLLFS